MTAALIHPDRGRVRGTGCPVHVGYLDDHGREVRPADVAVIPAG